MLSLPDNNITVKSRLKLLHAKGSSLFLIRFSVAGNTHRYGTEPSSSASSQPLLHPKSSMEKQKHTNGIHVICSGPV